jgi:hypothetical protein
MAPSDACRLAFRALGGGLLSICTRSKQMPLLQLVLVLIVVGVLLHLINRYIPMASGIKTILNVVVIIVVCIWLLQATGLWAGVSTFRLGK